MDLKDIKALVDRAASLKDKAEKVTALVEAGVQLARVVRENLEEAAATISETDAAKLRARADELATLNRGLSADVDAALRG